MVDQVQHPPVVERNTAQSYTGDFGRVVGYGLQDFGGREEITVDLFIPPGSYMRDPVRLGAAATSISGLSTGDFFVISDSNVGLQVQQISLLELIQEKLLVLEPSLLIMFIRSKILLL